ncbi:MAG: right-handed parallel beta-helix repeat-containing protein [Betaproteobacteria bacterium]|nr:right-handed parallel beta-helix repeat-containing protein [Betaproteobacteria bacterium]
MSRSITRAVLLALLLGAAFTASAVQRTFVSTGGSDGNTAANCAKATPCRGFAAALTVTDGGGEIIVLDSGGYGSVTIAQTVSIIAPEGVYAGISVFSGNGVTIASAGVRVVLRGLSINGLGGEYGIHMSDGASLTVANCVISGFSTSSRAGLFLDAPAALTVTESMFQGNHYGARVQGGAKAQISDSKFLRNASIGVLVESGSSGTTRVSAERTVASGNDTGFSVNATVGNAHLAIRNSVANENGSYGLYADSSGSGTSVASASASVLSHNGSMGAVASGDNTRMVVDGNLIARNASYGLYQQSNAVLTSTGGNSVSANGLGASGGTITSAAKM